MTLMVCKRSLTSGTLECIYYIAILFGMSDYYFYLVEFWCSILSEVEWEGIAKFWERELVDTIFFYFIFYSEIFQTYKNIKSYNEQLCMQELFWGQILID